MKTQRIIVVAGMHRSGTSCVTGLVEALGVDFGEDIGRSKYNKWGFKEDVTFFDLHNVMLRRSKQSILVQDIGDVKTPTQSEALTANSLIEDREALRYWGWKNPRTALFLDFWHALIPEAQYVFVYRHPIEVVLSFLRRGADVEALVDPLMAVRSWQVYNRSILDFFRANKSRCILCNISEVAKDVDAVLACFSERLGLPDPPADARDAYHPSGLSRYRLAPEDELSFEAIAPQALDLYREMERAADLPSGAPEELGMPSESETHDLNMFQLLGRIDPKLTAETPGKLLERCQELRDAKVWAEEKIKDWQAVVEERGRVIAEQTLQISILEKGKAWLEDQLKNWRREVGARDRVIAERASQITALEEAKVWHEQHFKSLMAERASQITALGEAKVWQEQHSKSLMAEQALQVTALEEDKAWLAEQVENWKKSATHGESVIAEQTSLIEAFEETKAWLAGQVESWQSVVAHRDRVVAEQVALISALEEGKAWLAGQLENWQGIAAQREGVTAEQASHLAEVDAERRWLKEQVANWRGVVAHCESVIAELTSHGTEMESGRRWLEGQVESWRGLAEAREGVNTERMTQLSVLENDLTWLKEQVKNWQNVAEDRERSVDELTSYVTQMEEGTRWLEEMVENLRAEVKYLEDQTQGQRASIKQSEDGIAWLRKVMAEQQGEMDRELSECRGMLEQQKRVAKKNKAEDRKHREHLRSQNQYLSSLDKNPLFRFLAYLRLVPKRDI